jgi:hypothetical protein
MRALLAVCLSLLAAYPGATLQTFTSPDGVFQFKHPSVLVHCAQKQAQEGRWKRFTTSDSWTSGGQTGEIYRVFRASTCYEFGIQWASTSPQPSIPAQLSNSRSETPPRFPPPCNDPSIPSHF